MRVQVPPGVLKKLYSLFSTLIPRVEILKSIKQFILNYIIFDLEATCEKNNYKFINETIEIGAVKYNGQGEFLDEYCAFIKPILNPTLSKFCKELTTIEQSQVDNALTFPDAIEDFKKWININEPFLLCSWGLYDRKQLEKDSALHNINDIAWLENHISVKHQHGAFYNITKGMGMEAALLKEGFLLDGTHHRGIDDAKNIAKIFLKFIGKWTLPLE